MYVVNTLDLTYMPYIYAPILLQDNLNYSDSASGHQSNTQVK